MCLMQEKHISTFEVPLPESQFSSHEKKWSISNLKHLIWLNITNQCRIYILWNEETKAFGIFNF